MQQVGFFFNNIKKKSYCVLSPLLGLAKSLRNSVSQVRVILCHNGVLKNSVRRGFLVKNLTKKQMLMTTLLSAATISAFAAPAQAQVDDEEIIVTGSRIVKQDFISNSPVATVNAVQFERTGAINTENLLNTLPQTVPGLDRTSNNPGNGTATVDLRGLGANRTLVLVNGRRAMVNGAGGIVDINTIPPSQIENIEVLTGGASSVYGADAVSGVVNFILKDDFEGVEANAGYSITEEGDAETLDLSVTLGANTSDGRGNATVSIGYTDRAALFQGDRDFSETAFFDNADNTGLEPGGSSGVPGNSIFAGGFGGFSDSFGVVFDPDGSARPFVTSGDVNDFYNYAPVNFLQLPQERFTLGATANYEINDHAEVYLEGRFAQNVVDSQLAPTPIFQTSEFSLDGNPFLPVATQQLLSDAIGSGVDTDGDGIDDTASALQRRRLVEVGPRENSDTRNTFQFVAGIKGDFIKDWNYDISFSEGRTTNSSFQNGNVNRGRFDQALLLADADGDGNVDVGADGSVTCSDPGTNGSTLPCAPLNIFGPGNISADAAAFLNTAVSTTDETIQRVAQINFTGDLGGFSFTEDAIGVAVGGEYIENRFVFRPSQDVAASTIAGFNGAPALEGDYNVYSAYAEASVPLLSGLPFAESITLDLAGRVSDFSTVGTEYNYKVGGDWAINDQLRFRGNFNTAVRAPNIGELFAPIAENFPGADDPCSASGAPTGGLTAAQQATCLATGVPANVLGTAAINPAAGQIRSLAGGNPDLQVEEAETFTIGAVITPTVLDGLTLSVDYFDISIDDAVGLFGGSTDNILSTCILNDSGFGGAGSAFCNAVNRRADGTIDFVSNQAANVAGIDLQGFDIAAQYSFDAGNFGDISFNYLGTVTLTNEFEAFEGDQIFDCAGRFGNNCGEPDPSYRHRLTGVWNNSDWTAQLTWQLLGSVTDGGELDLPDPTPQFVDNIGTTHYFDGSVSKDFGENLSITVGVNNIFGENPPVIGDNDEQANTFPATFDVFGRTFFSSATVRF